MSADQHPTPPTGENDADPTETLLRATLGAAAAKTDVTAPADPALLWPVLTTADPPASNGRWLAAAAAALLVLGAGGVVLRTAQEESGVAEVNPSIEGASEAPGGSNGTAVQPAEALPPVPPITTVGAERPSGTQWLPVLSFGYLPNGLQAGPVWRASGAPDTPDGVYHVSQVMASADGNPEVLRPLGLSMSNQAPTRPMFVDEGYLLEPVVTLVGNDGLIWSLQIYGLPSAGTGELDAGSALDPHAQATSGDEHLSMHFSGDVKPDELRRVIQEMRIIGWQDASTIPVDPNPRTAPPDSPQPAPGSQDIWPTEPPADYCVGWQEYLNVQANAPGPASVNTAGFIRYTTQLDALAPAELAGEWARLRDLWGAPDKSSTSDNQDGSGAVHQRLYEVSMAACPGAALPNPVVSGPGEG